MAERTYYIGNSGPFYYDDAEEQVAVADASADAPADSVLQHAFRTDGQLRVETAPTNAKHILRLEDVASYIQFATVTDINAPDLSGYSGAFVGSLLVVTQANANTNEYIIYAWDDANALGVSSPNILAGSSGFWTAVGGKYRIGNGNLTGNMNQTGDFILVGTAQISTLTPSRVVVSDASKNLASLGYSIPSAIAQGDLLYGTGPTTSVFLTKDTNATRYLSNQGTSNNPSWNQVNLANGVTGSLPNSNLANSTITIAGVSTALGGSITETTMLDSIGSTRGMIPLRGALTWAGLAIGAANTFLKSDGTDASWAALTAGVIPDAAADGSTKGVATFTAADFNSSSGLISIDYANGQKATTLIPGFLTAADWTTFNAKVAPTRTINTTSPITGGGDLSADRTIAINDAAADGSTKGAAAFNSTNFSASSGVVNTIQGISTAASPTFAGLTINAAPLFDIVGGTTKNRGTAATNFSLERYQAGSFANQLAICRSRNATVGSHTIINNGDQLGEIAFKGSNGTSFDSAAIIRGSSNGTPGASSDMPGILDFLTSADGSATPTSRLTINSVGLASFTGAVTVTGITTLNNDALVKAGTSSSTAAIGGVLNINTTDVGNVGTGADNLMTYSIPANTLATNGDTVEFKMYGTFANTLAAKTIAIVYGGTTLVTFNSPVAADGTWYAHGSITRTSATAQRAIGYGWATDGAGNFVLANTKMTYTTPAETLSGAVTIKATGDSGAGGADNDVIQKYMQINWHSIGS